MNKVYKINKSSEIDADMSNKILNQANLVFSTHEVIKSIVRAISIGCYDGEIQASIPNEFAEFNLSCLYDICLNHQTHIHTLISDLRSILVTEININNREVSDDANAKEVISKHDKVYEVTK